MNKDDLISRAEAIKRLRDAENGVFIGFYGGLEMAYKIIANMPTAQQWHTGEPTEDGDYLVYDSEEYYTVDSYYTHEGTVEYGTPLAYKGWQSCNHVKYWMQIPKLPEVEE